MYSVYRVNSSIRNIAISTILDFDVLTIAIALRKFVLKNEDKFKSAYTIKAGLADLIKDLGGIS